MEHTIHLQGFDFAKVISKEKINEAINLLGQKLNFEYAERPRPIVMGILNGSFIFMADLVRVLNFECQLQFVRISSYQGMKAGTIELKSGLDPNWKDRDIILLEDIVDTGHTLYHFIPLLQSTDPKSVKVCTLLWKKEAMEVKAQVDYACFEIAKEFVVGYGLDFNGLGRNLPDIYQKI